MSPVSLYLSCFVAEQEANVRAALDEFSERLLFRYPHLPQVAICDSSELDRIHLSENFMYKIEDRQPSVQLEGEPAFIFCDWNAPIAKAACKKEPMAQWGAATPDCKIALAWTTDNKYLLWHEAMHLLGAVDCYEKGGQRKVWCSEQRCLMQYVPCETNWGGVLYLCKFIQKFV